jgi:hypothetical protein
MPEPGIEFEQKATSTHYLDDAKVRTTISENYPEIKIESLDNISRPKASIHPDEIETWELGKRSKRVDVIINSASDNPLKVIEMCLYEECFGVNATPGTNESFHESLAPTPGGILSHGYPHVIINDQTLASVSRLEFIGETAKECVESLADWSKKTILVNFLAEITAPTELGDFSSQRIQKEIKQRLLSPNLQPSEEVTNWALRLIKMVKECPEFSKPIQDPELKTLLGFNKERNVNLLDAWPKLWSQMSSSILEQNSLGSTVYKDPNNENTKMALERLLKIRLHPETQILFKYLSPSGYLNKD